MENLAFISTFMKSLGRNAGSDPRCSTRFFMFARQTVVENLRSIIFLVQLGICIRKRWYLKNFWSTHTKKPSLPFLLSFLYLNTDTCIRKVIILKNNKTQPQTHMRTTVISSSIYRQELWCRFSLHAFPLLQILVLVVPQLPQAQHGKMKESAVSSDKVPPSSSLQHWRLCYRFPPPGFSNKGNTLSLFRLTHLTF